MSLLEKLRLGFLARTRREKMLAAFFLIVMAALWLVFLVDRVKAFAPRLHVAKELDRTNAIWIEDEPNIAARYDQALADLKDRKVNAAAAYAKVDNILRGTPGLQFRMDPPSSTRQEQLTLAPININISKADYFQLRDLYQAIMRELPTVNLEEVTIASPGRAVAGEAIPLDAKFKFVAIEIND